MTPNDTGERKPLGLTPAEIRRYIRQTVIPGIGLEGQVKLKKAAVLVVGAGGLGSPAAIYLAAAGLGRIGLVDDDVVEAANLQRQILYAARDVGRKKVRAAAARLEGLNPRLAVEIHGMRLTAKNAPGIVSGYDVVLDCTDNFPARYVINDACILSKKPMVHGAVHHLDGQVSVFDAAKGPCYRCLLSEPPAAGAPDAARTGVLGIIPGIIGTIQAAEAIKLILGLGRPLVGRMLFYDARGAFFDEMPIAKNPDCPACGPGRNK